MQDKDHCFLCCFLLLFLSSSSLFASFSIGSEITPMFTTSLVGSYEQQKIRWDAAVHVFPSEVADALQSENPLKELGEMPLVYKGQMTYRFTPWDNHGIYGGIGALCYAEHYDGDYMLALGPSMQYLWRIPDSRWELKVGLTIPLIGRSTYEQDTNDDFISVAGLVAILLIMESPSIAIHYRF